MSNIDRQRIAAVRKLERLGYTFAAGDWHAPVGMTVTPTSVQADAMHALLVQRAPTPWRDARWDSS